MFWKWLNDEADLHTFILLLQADKLIKIARHRRSSRTSTSEGTFLRLLLRHSLRHILTTVMRITLQCIHLRNMLTHSISTYLPLSLLYYV